MRGALAATGAIALGWGIWTGRAAAAFELRADGVGTTAHLPDGAPAPFASPLGRAAEDLGPGEGAWWSVGALHASLFGLAELPFDAVGAERQGRRFCLRGHLSRLAAPGAAEWTAALGIGLAGRIHAEARLLRVEPARGEFEGTEAASRAAGTLSLGLAHRFGPRLSLEGWFCDFARAGSVRSLALAASGWAAVSLRVAPALRLRIARRWTDHEMSRRWEVAWAAAPELTVSHGGSAPRQGAATSVQGRFGSLSGWAWSSRVHGELPATTGAGIAWRSTREGGAASGSKGEAAGAQATPRTAFEIGSPGVIASELEDEPRLRIDGEPVMEVEQRDSLGAWVDSMTAAYAEAGAGPSLGLKGSVPPASLESVTIANLRSWAGLDSLTAASLLAAIRHHAPGASPDTSLPVPLRRAWREAAPYLTDGNRRLGPSEVSGRGGGTARVRWRRDDRWRIGVGPRRRDRLDLSAQLGALGGEAVFLRDRSRSTGRILGAGVLRHPWARFSFGRGGNPLVWGTGMIGRPVPMDLSNGVTQGVSSAPARPSWKPQLGGADSFATAEFLPNHPVRLLIGRRGPRQLRGILASRGGWTVGVLQRSGDRADPLSDLWVRRFLGGQALEVEWVRRSGGSWHRVLRAAASERLGGGRSVVWYEGTLGTSPRQVLPAFLPPSEPDDPSTGFRWNGGWRHPRGSATLSASDETRHRSGTDRRTRRAGARLRLVRPEGGAARVQVDAASSASRDAAVESWSPDSWRWRHRLRARADLRQLVRGAVGRLRIRQWGVEFGWERSGVVEGQPRLSRWTGAWAQGEPGRSVLKLGFLEVWSPKGIDLTPTWCPGVRSRLTSGLWLASTCSWRTDRLELAVRGLQALFGPGTDRGLLLVSIDWHAERRRRGRRERAGPLPSMRRGPARRTTRAIWGFESRRWTAAVGTTRLHRDLPAPPPRSSGADSGRAFARRLRLAERRPAGSLPQAGGKRPSRLPEPRGAGARVGVSTGR